LGAILGDTSKLRLDKSLKYLGEGGIRTYDTEGRILAPPATICAEMTGFRP
jgi:hypothetical protein